MGFVGMLDFDFFIMCPGVSCFGLLVFFFSGNFVECIMCGFSVNTITLVSVKGQVVNCCFCSFVVSNNGGFRPSFLLWDFFGFLFWSLLLWFSFFWHPISFVILSPLSLPSAANA